MPAFLSGVGCEGASLASRDEVTLSLLKWVLLQHCDINI